MILFSDWTKVYQMLICRASWLLHIPGNETSRTERNQVYKPQERAIAATNFSVLRGFSNEPFVVE